MPGSADASMTRNTDDLRIRQVRPLIPPAILVEEMPVTATVADTVSRTRIAIADALAGRDPRLVVIVGPCSIHDPASALDYAGRLLPLACRYHEQLVVVLRAYFEKPRSSVGWKGLVNDPDLDGSHRINTGLRLARGLLLDINGMGMPTASEFLDTQIPQHIGDLTSWVAIGARTTESQVHREMASGLSMPVGFKNGTSGNVNIAVEAVLAARSPHWFRGVTKQGTAAILETVGNDTCHVILRGGTRTGPNYAAEYVSEACERLRNAGLPERVMVDCSHGNSGKDHRRQPAVAASVGEQIEAGTSRIFGVMLESHLVEGRQDYRPGASVYGQSITDACISFEQTERVLERLAAAQQKRRGSSHGTNGRHTI
jgi:3-deoxy-7-phosphoheptulonate synthase